MFKIFKLVEKASSDPNEIHCFGKNNYLDYKLTSIGRSNQKRCSANNWFCTYNEGIRHDVRRLNKLQRTPLGNSGYLLSMFFQNFK